jgi:colanic acid/amylovoran biosynthesis glycosyltransferase
MRTVFFVPSFPELSESFILRQAIGLLDRGHDVRVLAQRVGQGAAHPQVHEYRLLERTRYVPAGLLAMFPSRSALRRPTNLFKAVAAAVALAPRRSIRKRVAAIQHVARLGDERADVVHCHYGETGLLFGASAILWDAPLVVSFYGYDCSSYVRRHGPEVYAPLFSRTAVLVALSERMKLRLVELGADPDKIVLQPLSVDTRTFAPPPAPTQAGACRILTVARLTEKKGIEYAIRGVARIMAHEPRITYDIIGEGPLRAHLEQLVAALGLQASVRFLGALPGPAVASAMQGADVFVLPSVTATDGDEEGTPTVLLEAAACALPVVATRHSGIPEIVEDGVTGLLVGERDAVALAAALRALLADPERRAAMGRTARRRVENHHDVERVSAGLQAIYEGAVARHRAHRRLPAARRFT